MPIEYTNQNGDNIVFEPGENGTAERISVVNHPKHYNRDGAIECIDEMEIIFGTEFVMHFCLGNVFKYRYRAGLKNNGYEDLEKSDWYMKKYKELKEKTSPNVYCHDTTHVATYNPWNISTKTYCNAPMMGDKNEG